MSTVTFIGLRGNRHDCKVVHVYYDTARRIYVKQPRVPCIGEIVTIFKYDYDLDIYEIVRMKVKSDTMWRGLHMKDARNVDCLCVRILHELELDDREEILREVGSLSSKSV